MSSDAVASSSLAVEKSAGVMGGRTFVCFCNRWVVRLWPIGDLHLEKIKLQLSPF